MHKSSYEHMLEVAELNKSFGKYLGMKEEELECLFACGLFHDIGKLMLPIEILTKKETLSEEELNKIKEHPKLGVILLKKVELEEYEPYRFFIENTILSHHYFNNEQSYPQGISINKSIYADITSICDAYQALSSNRDYKEPFPLEKCISILKEGDYDKDLLNSFISFMLIKKK